MGWLTDLKLPVQLGTERKTIVQLQKVNLASLEVCHPVMLVREQSFYRTDRADIIHVREDGTVSHTTV